MVKLLVSTKCPYEVIVGHNMLNQLADEIVKVHALSKAVIVCDENVEKLYLQTVKDSLLVAGFTTKDIVIKSGEQNKTPQTYLEVIDQMAQFQLGRMDLVVALGGGVVGDIAGFAAATYMRGIAIVQVPTTLLSAIDASVGGKTGVDLEQGKNLLGAFWQPKLVFFDSATLSTLCQADIQNGIAEGIKYAVLNGGEIFDILNDGLSKDNISRFVELCVGLKRDIVVADELESGERKLLNLGHTFGHAIEMLSDFKIPHGMAVAKGMHIVAKASVASKVLSKQDYAKICGLFEKYSLDTSCDFTIDEMLSVIKMDKKVGANGEIFFVDIKAIGDCDIKQTSFENLKEYINGC